MKLDSTNYYSLEADRAFWSVSQYKSMCRCQAATMAKLRGEYTEPTTKAMLAGSFFDAYFDGTLEQFMRDHKEIFTQRNTLRAEFKKANEMIARVTKDPLFMQFMSGEKQKIMIAEMFGVEWKLKPDSVIKDVCGTDLKSAANFQSLAYFRYDIQLSVYQEGEYQNGYGKLPQYLDVCTKEKIPDFDIFQILQPQLDLAFNEVGENMPRFIAVKNGEVEPESCGVCPYCKSIKKARIRSYSELLV